MFKCISGCKRFPFIRFCATGEKINNMNRLLTVIDSFPRKDLQVPRNAFRVVSKQTSVCAYMYTLNVLSKPSRCVTISVFYIFPSYIIIYIKITQLRVKI